MEPTKFYVGDELKHKSDGSCEVIEVSFCDYKECSEITNKTCTGEHLSFRSKRNGVESFNQCGSKNWCTLVTRAKGAETLKINPKEEVMEIPKHVSDNFDNTQEALLVAKWFPVSATPARLDTLTFQLHRIPILREAKRLEDEEKKAQEGK